MRLAKYVLQCSLWYNWPLKSARICKLNLQVKLQTAADLLKLERPELQFSFWAHPKIIVKNYSYNWHVYYKKGHKTKNRFTWNKNTCKHTVLAHTVLQPHVLTGKWEGKTVCLYFIYVLSDENFLLPPTANFFIWRMWQLDQFIKI